MRQFLLITVLLGRVCSGASAQEALLQQEGKFLSPRGLSPRGDNVLLGMTVASVPGYPISGTIEAENTGTDSHGKTAIASYRSKIYRDSKGRTRLEWDMTPLGEAPKPGWFNIEIYDPTTRTIIHLQPSIKAASMGHFRPPTRNRNRFARNPISQRSIQKTWHSWPFHRFLRTNSRTTS